MRVVMNNCVGAFRADAIALLSQMQSILSEWLAMPRALEQCPIRCRTWRAQLYEVAGHARAAGLHAYSSLSVRIGERLEPSFRSEDIPRSQIQLLLRWAQASLGYLRQGADCNSAVELVALLDVSQESRQGAEERAFLLRGLIEDHEREGQLGTRSEPDLRSVGRR